MKKIIEPQTKLQLLKHPLRTAVLLWRIATVCARLKPIVSFDYVKLFCRTARLCHKERFSPQEAFAIGLLSDDLPESETAKYYSRKKLIKVQKAFNPEPWSPILKDKSIMYRYCMMAGLRIPELYGVFFKNCSGISQDGTIRQTRDEWARFIVHQLPAEFVLKPTDGSLGRGIRIFKKNQLGFCDQNGKTYQPRQIYDLMNSDQDAAGYIIQQKLDNHPDIVALTGNDNLQTIRMITFVDSSGTASILQAHIKMVTGNNTLDNFILGTTGNIQADIDVSTGIILSAIAPTRRYDGTVPIEFHPESGNRFEDFNIPHWQQACELILLGARQFLPIRSIGWDIAITPNGPAIVEGNFWWNPPNQHRCMSNIIAAMQLS